MPLPVALAAGLAGALLGGGTQVTQTTTSAIASTNNFTPTIVIGGDSNSSPLSPVSNDFDAVTTTSQTQEQADPSDLLAAFNPAATGAEAALSAIPSLIGGSSASVASSAVPSAFATPAPITSAFSPTTVAAIGAAVVVGLVVFKPKKKGA